MRSTIAATVLALVLIGGTTAAQSPSPLPAASPVVSPGIPSGAGVVPTLRAVDRKGCATGLVCTWYLTIAGSGLPGGAFVTTLTRGAPSANGKRTPLTPAVPLPVLLPPGTYFLEGSAWTQDTSASTASTKQLGLTASCGTVLVVDPTATGGPASIRLTFRPKRRGCALAATVTPTPTPTSVPAISPAPASAAP